MTEEPEPPKPPAGASLWARAAWTALPLVVALLGGGVLLPGIDEGALPSPRAARSLGVFALGVMPFVSASLLVELVALAVPHLVIPPDRRATRPEAPRVNLQLTPEGARRFEDFTAANVKRRLAILVDGRVVSAPVIFTRIPGGNVSITMGTGDPEQQLADARRLARELAGR